MNLHAKNVSPGTVAKQTIEKANAAGAKGKKLKFHDAKYILAFIMVFALPWESTSPKTRLVTNLLLPALIQSLQIKLVPGNQL